jgi:BASS family bile acid:Na+ symporter
MLATLTRLFPLWALLLSVIAYYTPSTFTPVGPLVPSLLMLIMFGMGVHLKVDDFKRVLHAQPRSRRVFSCTIW